MVDLRSTRKQNYIYSKRAPGDGLITVIPLKKQAQEKKQAKKQEDMTETLKRLQADYENYKKRVEKQKEEFTKYANADFASKLLPILDNLSLALRNTSTEQKEFVKGMELIYSEFIDVLKAEGLEMIDAEGKKFDPYLHEALMQEESDKEPETITEELQKGYIFKDRVLRHTKVKLAKKKDDKNGNDKH